MDFLHVLQFTAAFSKALIDLFGRSYRKMLDSEPELKDLMITTLKGQHSISLSKALNEHDDMGEAAEDEDTQTKKSKPGSRRANGNSTTSAKRRKNSD